MKTRNLRLILRTGLVVVLKVSLRTIIRLLRTGLPLSMIRIGDMRYLGLNTSTLTGHSTMLSPETSMISLSSTRRRGALLFLSIDLLTLIGGSYIDVDVLNRVYLVLICLFMIICPE